MKKTKKKTDKLITEEYMKIVRQSKGMLKGGGSLIKALMKEKKRELKAEERKYKLLYGI